MRVMCVCMNACSYIYIAKNKEHRRIWILLLVHNFNRLVAMTVGHSMSESKVCMIKLANKAVSGLYWINTTSGIHQVYCNMELQCGGYKGGWTRVVVLLMVDSPPTALLEFS